MTDAVIQLLIAEREKIDRAIVALGGGKKRGRPRKDDTPPAWVTSGTMPKAVTAVVTRKKRTFTAAQRKEQAQRMKKYWAAKRKAAA